MVIKIYHLLPAGPPAGRPEDQVMVMSSSSLESQVLNCIPWWKFPSPEHWDPQPVRVNVCRDRKHKFYQGVTMSSSEFASCPHVVINRGQGPQLALEGPCHPLSVPLTKSEIFPANIELC